MPGKELVPRPPQPLVAGGMPPWQPPKKPEKAYKTIGKWCYRNRHFTVPLAIPPLLWLAALILHRFHATGGVLVVGGVLTGAVAFFASHKWDRENEQWYARISAAVASLWLWLATWFGPVRGEITALVLGSLLLALTIAWGIPWWKHKRPRGWRRRQKQIAKWGGWWQEHCLYWQLGGSHVIGAKETETRCRLHIQGVPGRHSFAYVERACALIPSALGGQFPPECATPFPDPEDGSRFFLELRKVNPLAKVVEYDLALAPRSVSDRAVIGKTETGDWKHVTMLKSRFVIGQIGSGKSNFLSVEATNLAGCMDGWQILIDLKGGRSARPLLPQMDYVAVTLDEARTVLQMLHDEGIARSADMYHGEEQHTPTVQDPAIHLFIDETFGVTSVTAGDADCARLLMLIASMFRAVSIYVEVFTQYGSLESSVRDEQTRSNLPVRVVFRVEQARHGAYAIEEYAKLDASKLEEPGTFFIKDGPKATPVQVRAPHLPHDLLKRIALQNYTLKADRPLLRLYAQQWQGWWDARWDRLPENFRKDSPQYQARAALLAAASPAQAWQAHQDIRDAAVPAEPLPASEPGKGDGASTAARIAQEQARFSGLPDDFIPSPKLVARQPRTMSRKRQAFANALESATRSRPATPRQLAEESGMSESWVYQTLAALTETGAAIKVRNGHYAPAGADQDIADAIDAIRDRNDELLKEHRRSLHSV
jgi:hypothetical protein